MTTYVKALEAVQGYIERMIQPPDGLGDAVNNLQQCIAADIEDLEEAIDNLHDEAEQMRTRITELQAEVRALEREVDNMEKQKAAQNPGTFGRLASYW